MDKDHHVNLLLPPPLVCVYILSGHHGTNHPFKQHAVIRQCSYHGSHHIRIFPRWVLTTNAVGYSSAQQQPNPVAAAEILGDPYLRLILLLRIPNYRKTSLDTEPLTWTPNYYVANTVWSKPSQLVLLNGKTPFSTVRHHQRIRVLQSLTNIMT